MAACKTCILKWATSLFLEFFFFSLFIIIASRALSKIGHSHHMAVSPLAPTKLINYD